MINSRDPLIQSLSVLEKVQKIFLIFPIDFLFTVIISLITEISKSICISKRGSKRKEGDRTEHAVFLAALAEPWEFIKNRI